MNEPGKANTLRWAVGIGLTILTAGVATWQGWVQLGWHWLGRVMSSRVPGWWFATFVIGVLLVWVTARAFARRRKASVPIAFLSYPRWGYRDLGYEEWQGVKWLLQFPNPDPFPSVLKPPPSPSEIAADLNAQGPYCPRCQTKLAEHQRLLWGFVWVCNKCGFRTPRGHSIYTAREQAERVFQSEMEKAIRIKKGVVG